MTAFVKLHTLAGIEILVNLDNVTTVRPDGPGSDISFLAWDGDTSDGVSVRETVEEIRSLA